MLKQLRSAITFFSFGLSLLLFPVASCPGQVVNGSTLSVNGTAAANNISFAIDADELVVTVDGAESRFDLAQVNRLSVNSQGGDDTVINNTHIAMFVQGGPGDDYIVGGSGEDVLRGGGDDDSLFGRDGQDYLDGGPDTDFLSGGNGDDELLANLSIGSDLDVMFGGAGDDSLNGGIEMSGGPGDDDIRHSAVLNPTQGAFLSGGPGEDELAFSGVNTTVRGGTGSDSIRTFSSVVSISAETALQQSDVDGGPDLDVINGRLLELGIVLRNNGELFAAGGAADDIIVVVREGTSDLAVEVSEYSYAYTIFERFNPSEVVSINLNGLEGNDQLFNLSDIPTKLFGGPGNDMSVTNTDLDLCINDNEGGRDVYVLHGGRVEHTVLGNVDFDAITIVGSERDEEVEFTVFNSGAVAAVTSQIDLGPGDDFYDGSLNGTAPVTVRGGSGNDIFIGSSADDERFFWRCGRRYPRRSLWC